MRNAPRLLIYLSLLTLLCPLTATRIARGAPLHPETYDCEGDACAAVTLTWEQERQQFCARNESDRPAKVEVTTFAGRSVTHVPARQSEYLEVKTFNGPYRADYE